MQCNRCLKTLTQRCETVENRAVVREDSVITINVGIQSHGPCLCSLILVEQSDSRIATMIHMMFVFFPIAAIWIDQSGQVVDTCLAKPFRLLYVPRAPAKYVLEGDPSLLNKIKAGDKVEFVPVA